MSIQSDHLEKIIAQYNRIANIQIVSADVEKYSLRRSLTQIDVINAFTNCFKNALNETSRYYVEYAQKNDINFQNDIISLPTGDGAIVGFSFDGLHDIHLYFATKLLEEAYKLRQQNFCERFDKNGWCNCHSSFNLRIGLSEGKGIIYSDVNGTYNIAGGVVNLASRIISLLDRNQIAFTEDAYRCIIDMVKDPNFIDHFIEFQNIKLKHGIPVRVYQFIDKDQPHINSSPPSYLNLSKKTDEFFNKMKSLGFPMPEIDPNKINRESGMLIMENIMNQVLKLFAQFITVCSNLK